MKLLEERTLDIKTISEANDSSHWTVKSKRHQNQKRSIWWDFRQYDWHKLPLPLHIKLTRLASRELDYVNLVSSMKYIQDAIAEQFFPGLAPGQADSSKELTWEFAQEKASRKVQLKVSFYADI